MLMVDEFIKKIRFLKVWSELDTNVVGVKAMGNYNKFVTNKFVKTTFVSKDTSSICNYKDYYNNILDNGGCIFFKGYLIFREGFEIDYLNYLKDYIGNLNKEDLKLLYLLNKDSNLSLVKTYLNLFKQGVLSQETLINTLEKYFYKKESLLYLIA